MFNETKYFPVNLFGNKYFDPMNLPEYTKNCPTSEFTDILDLIDREFKSKAEAETLVHGSLMGIALDVCSRCSDPKLQKRALQLFDKILDNREKASKKDNLERQQKGISNTSYIPEVFSTVVFNTIVKASPATADTVKQFKNLLKSRIKNRCAELQSEPENLKKFRAEFEKYGGTEYLPLLIDSKQQAAEKPAESQVKHTSESIFKEGINCPFSLSQDEKISKFMLPEVRQTESARWKTSSKDPNILEIEGVDAKGNHTFSLGLNKKTGHYIYQGGKPSKIYSDNPSLTFPPMPEKALSCLKYNSRLAGTKAMTQANLKNGIAFKESDGKTVNATRPRECFAEIKLTDAQGKPTAWFLVDTRTGEYRAKDLKTGELYSNRAKDKSKCKGELPPEIVSKMKGRANKALNIAQSQAMSNNGHPGQREQRQ